MCVCVCLCVCGILLQCFYRISFILNQCHYSAFGVSFSSVSVCIFQFWNYRILGHSAILCLIDVKNFIVANDIQLRITLIILRTSNFPHQKLVKFPLYLATGEGHCPTGASAEYATVDEHKLLLLFTLAALSELCHVLRLQPLN